MRKCLVILAGMMVVAVAMPATAFAGTPKVMGAGINLMKNGGFEKPVVAAGSFAEFTTGQTFKHWTVVGASGNVAVVSGTFTQAGFSFPAQSGNQWLDLTGTSNTPTGVSQTFATVSGQNYTLTFWVGNVYDPGGIFGTTSTVNVSVNGTHVLSATNSQQSTTQVWQKFKVHFAATSTSTQIAFLNGDPSNDTTNGLDSVKLSLQA